MDRNERNILKILFPIWHGGQMQRRSTAGELIELGTVSALRWNDESDEEVVLASIDFALERINGKWWPGPRRSILVSRLEVAGNILEGICGRCEDWDTEREEVQFLEPGKDLVSTPAEETHRLEDLLETHAHLSVRSLCDRKANTVTISVVEINRGEADCQRWRTYPVTFDFSFEDIGEFRVSSIDLFPNGIYEIWCSFVPMDSGMCRTRRAISGKGRTIEAAIENMLHPVRR